MPHLKAIIQHIQAISPTVLDITVAQTNGQMFPDFLPGQYATVSFPDHQPLKGERSFSIASPPSARMMLHFGVRVGGQYSTAMRALRRGDRVMVGMPYGHFTFHPQRDASAVMIAGGIGITPFLSMIQAATDLKLPNDLTLLYSIRSMTDASYADIIDRNEERNPNFRAIYAVSDKNVPTGNNRIVPGYIDGALLRRVLSDTVWGRTFLLCGPPAFMKAMIKNLQHLGLAPGDIMTEQFGISSTDIIERGTPVPAYVFASWGVAAAVLLGVVYQRERERRAVVTVPPLTANTNTVETTLPVPTNTQTPGADPTITTNTPTRVTPAPTVSPTPVVKTQPRPKPRPVVQPPVVVPRTTVS